MQDDGNYVDEDWQQIDEPDPDWPDDWPAATQGDEADWPSAAGVPRQGASHRRTLARADRSLAQVPVGDTVAVQITESGGAAIVVSLRDLVSQ